MTSIGVTRGRVACFPNPIRIMIQQ
jgi:hypothetical protein